MAQPGRRFFATLDGIRGVAAIMVVRATAIREGDSPGTISRGRYFFVLSGVVITNAYEHRFQSGLSVLSFAILRTIRLYPLYILGTAIRLIAIGAGLIMVGSSSVGNGRQLAGPLFFELLALPDPFVFSVFPLNRPAWSLF